MSILRARKKLSDIEVSGWPYLKKERRSMKAEILQRQAITQEELEKKVAKPEDFDRIYGKVGSVEDYLNDANMSDKE